MARKSKKSCKVPSLNRLAHKLIKANWFLFRHYDLPGDVEIGIWRKTQPKKHPKYYIRFYDDLIVWSVGLELFRVNKIYFNHLPYLNIICDSLYPNNNIKRYLDEKDKFIEEVLLA